MPAEQCGVGKSHLFHLFRKFPGSFPGHYLVERRIGTAKDMPLQPSMPIKSISGSCGFRDIEVFHRNFKRIADIVPGAYRDENI